MIKVIGVRFRGGGKVYYFDPDGVELKREDQVIVETVRGVEIGTVLLVDKEISDDEVPGPIKKIMRKATEEDKKKAVKNLEKEKEALKICEEKIAKRELEMKLVGAEYTFDNNKLIFYFTADGRIDFRELVKDLAAVFIHVSSSDRLVSEMRQSLWVESVSAEESFAVRAIWQISCQYLLRWQRSRIFP